MERRDGDLFYFCAIPYKTIVPTNFILKEIKPHSYLVVEHIGSMGKINNTYEKIYRKNNSQQYLFTYKRYLLAF